MCISLHSNTHVVPPSGCKFVGYATLNTTTFLSDLSMIYCLEFSSDSLTSQLNRLCPMMTMTSPHGCLVGQETDKTLILDRSSRWAPERS